MARDEQLSLTADTERKLALVELYRQIAALTEPHCASGSYECRQFHLAGQYRCCERAYCEKARKRAAAWGVTVPETGNPTLPFMSPGGCVMPPYLRPDCAVHLCHISFAGQEHLGRGTTEAYWELRKKIDSLEREG